METNKCIFIDIFNCLIKTRSGKTFPIHQEDWVFQDNIIDYIINNDIVLICLVNDIPVVFNKRKQDILINFIQDKLIKICKKEIHSIFYNEGDAFFNYPNPGGVYNFAIEHNIVLNDSKYITSNHHAFSSSSIGGLVSNSKIILNDKE